MKDILKGFSIIIIVVSCIILAAMGASVGRKDSIDDKDKRNEHWVWWVDPKTGKGRWFIIGGESPLPNGKYTLFYYNGNIYQEGNWENGKDIDTLFRYGLHNNLIYYDIYRGDSEQNYIINNGTFKDYFQNGKLQSEGIVENHLVGNKWTEYYENSVIQSSYENDGKNGLVLYYTSERKLKTKIIGELHPNNKNIFDFSLTNLKATVQNAVVTIYYENGQTKDSARIVNGYLEGLSYHWFENGNLDVIVYFEKGLGNGPKTEYHENGKLKYSYVLRNDKVEGSYKVYDPTGKFIEERFYNNGTRIK